MKEIIPLNRCTGCMVCKETCHMNAITIEENKGYYYPMINETKCVDCGACTDHCHAANEKPPFQEYKEVYLAWNKDERIRNDSSSGGVFAAFADAILDKDGVVIGAAYENGFSEIRHIAADNKIEANRLRLSKYVQSSTEDIWKTVRDLIDNRKLVLFAGTPCQISALYSFIGKKADNLYTVDLVCRGVPSPILWKEYAAKLEAQYNSNLTYVNYRYKGEYGWTQRKVKFSFGNGESYITTRSDDEFAKLFFGNIVMRKSCFDCRYSDKRRIGDITLGDFWALKKEDIIDKEKGLSMILINNEKGQSIFEMIKDDIEYSVARCNDISLNNSGLGFKHKESPLAEKYWDTYSEYGYEQALNVLRDEN